jgi:hypothetical protein
MSYNPYSEETLKTRMEQIYPRMDDLTPKPQPQVVPVVPVQPVVTETPHTPDPALRKDEAQGARTAIFAIGKFNDFLVWFLMIIETMLALRFLLKLIGADPGVLFAGFLYAVTDILLLPFLNIVHSPTIHPPNQSFEFSTLIGMLVYFLIFYALKRFVHLLITPPEDAASS